MSDNQQPKPYDAVLGNQNQAPEGAAVLGGIEGVKLRLSNENPEVRIKALHQALNYGELGIDLIIEALEDESPEVQIKAHSLLVPLSEQKVKRVLIEFNPHNLKLEAIEVVTVNRCGEIIQRQQHLARYFVEDLGNGIELEMAYIPGGTFLMGAPEAEKEHYVNNTWERTQPQHQVTLQPFYMGKFTVTQAQWEVVTNLPRIAENFQKIDRSYFKGDNQPVDRIFSSNAVDFCASLSKITGKQYRLPSEAEWEYACRAGTTTPFHYGETITTELANYNGRCLTYASEPRGEQRHEITPVGQFPPNAFGLYDMHGNLREWCQDSWHENYIGAPTDGSAWIDNNRNKNKKYYRRVFRGGTWCDNPRCCSSASRSRETGLPHYTFMGLRLACDIF
ncbi:MAG: SUMF1/EgtB/PvdO family nonheme iron enzyme [Rivularia sp. (in: cyanobacteria)]